MCGLCKKVEYKIYYNRIEVMRDYCLEEFEFYFSAWLILVVFRPFVRCSGALTHALVIDLYKYVTKITNFFESLSKVFI